ncbi:TPA: O-antigen ligase C-terminal domain-containing protein [Serratia marcescens]|uniref:PglL family O-oligosaccharyltransferase n=1 Tax=Serratia TaxID=613 RepID=UPI0013DBF748|nr:Wzy polymerase domain-containing protein [Serratia marcescens]MBH2855463.1 O-antigen ligase C-terminal domain-containing protein [Serratia marcescens]MBH3286782.1 O-antigen ligase C-terminal domain-containing protein [Serratia marcescens]MBN5435279.1 O-antigen ligase C-terminal domain-containing protein [Serratia marcescens]HAT3795363.1 polymerase [Serratia marcescens]HEI9729370.1 O-antigen ligase C-terminal domain-containing protein [Serratia marcescens]
MKNITYVMLAGLMAFCVNLYVVNNGGAMLTLPINAVVWIVISLVVLFSAFFRRGRKHVFTTKVFLLQGVGLAVLAIPLFYTSAVNFSQAGWRIAGLIFGGVFYFAWLQLRFSRMQQHGVFCVLLLVVTMQAVLALLQLFAPTWAWVPLRGSRVYGVFQQPNVLASFLATGLALALMLFLLPGFALARARYEHCRQIFLSVLLLVLPALLVWVNSRVGWLGGVLVALLFLWRFGLAYPARCKTAAGLLIVGVAVGLAGFMLNGEEGGVRYLSHDGSNQARLSMLRDTLGMIAAKPLLGWGYGGFEYSFMHFRIMQSPPTIVTEIANHPHNEILLWWVEGGIVALLGMGLIIAGIIRLVIRAWLWDRQALAEGRRRAGEPTALCFVLLPITLHTQLEYPFYLSVLHFMVFLLLLAMLDRQVSGVMGRKALPSPIGWALRGVLPVMSVGVMVVMVFALQGGLTLTRAERAGLVDVREVKAMPALAAWVHRERKIFDEQVNVLLRYNATRDEALLESYAQWAQAYLSRKIDANVYASLIAVLRHQSQDVVAEQYLWEAGLLFPTDARFRHTLHISVGAE